MIIKATGFAGLQELLEGLPKKVADKALRPSLRAGAKVIAAETVAMAPIDTGTMEGNITVRAMKRKRNRIGYRVTLKNSFEMVRHTKVGNRYFYPSLVEYGSSQSPPDPFMRPAFDSKKNEATDIIAGVLRTKLEERASPK